MRYDLFPSLNEVQEAFCPDRIEKRTIPVYARDNMSGFTELVKYMDEKTTHLGVHRVLSCHALWSLDGTTLKTLAVVTSGAGECFFAGGWLFLAVAQDSLIAHQMHNVAVGSKVDWNGLTFLVGSNTNYKFVYAYEECRRIERQCSLRLTAQKLSKRLTQDANAFSHLPELSAQLMEVQYAKTSCAYVLQQSTDEVEAADDLLQELLKFEADKLVPMREWYARFKSYSDKVARRCQRLWRYEFILAEHPELETYRTLLEREWVSQLQFVTQPSCQIDELEPALQQADERESLNLMPMREQAKLLDLRVSESRSGIVKPSQQDKEQTDKSQHNQTILLLKQKREQQEQEWHKAQVNTSTGRSPQTNSGSVTHRIPVTHADASKKLNILIDHFQAGGNILAIKSMALKLRQECERSRDTTAPHKNSGSEQSNGGDSAAIAGAVIGGLIGWLGGPFGAVIGATIGGITGTNIDEAKASSQTSSCLVRDADLTKWDLLITEIDNLISSLSKE